METEELTRWEKIRRSLPVVAVVAAVLFGAYVGAVRLTGGTWNHPFGARTAVPAAANGPAYSDCMGWLTRTDMALYLTPEVITTEDTELGALLICRYTDAKTATVRFISEQGKVGEMPMEIDITTGIVQFMAKATVPPTPRGYYRVEFVLDGRVAAKTWIQVNAPKKGQTGPK